MTIITRAIMSQKRALFHSYGRSFVTMETIYMKFVYLVSASDVLSYVTLTKFMTALIYIRRPP